MYNHWLNKSNIVLSFEGFGAVPTNKNTKYYPTHSSFIGTPRFKFKIALEEDGISHHNGMIAFFSKGGLIDWISEQIYSDGSNTTTVKYTDKKLGISFEHKDIKITSYSLSYNSSNYKLVITGETI